jgi:hypothetical protein
LRSGATTAKEGRLPAGRRLSALSCCSIGFRLNTVDDDYEFRRFAPSGADVSPETRGWLQANAQRAGAYARSRSVAQSLNVGGPMLPAHLISSHLISSPRSPFARTTAVAGFCAGR